MCCRHAFFRRVLQSEFSGVRCGERGFSLVECLRVRVGVSLLSEYLHTIN